MVKLPPKTRNSEDHQRDCRECHDQDNPAYYAQRLGQIQHMAESIRPSGVVRFPVRSGVAWWRFLAVRRAGHPHSRANCRPLTLHVRSRCFLAMQKVVGSSPIIRLGRPAGNGGFSCALGLRSCGQAPPSQTRCGTRSRRCFNRPRAPATTLARLTGHADAGFTLRVYARDSRDEAAVVKEVVGRAEAAGIGT